INPTLESTFTTCAQRFAALEHFLETQVGVLREAIFIETQKDSFQVSIDSLRAYYDNDFVMYELFRPFGFSISVLTDLSRTLQQAKVATGKTFYSTSHCILINREELLIKRIDQRL